MRLTRLMVQGIGPYRARQEVDFSALTATGLFLIDGPTGVGKSTLIDAITFALFGDSEKDGTKGRMRSDLCGPDEESVVELDFIVAGVEHRIRRTPAYLRTKLRGTGETEVKASQSLVRTDLRSGVVLPPLTAAAEVGVAVSDAFGGMSREQFRQLVVLPQGEFAALLRMSATERKRALSQLMGQQLFTDIQADLKARGDAARADRDAAAAKILTKVAAVREALRGLGAEWSERQILADDPDAAHVEVGAIASQVAHEAAGYAQVKLACDEAWQVCSKRHEDLRETVRLLTTAESTLAAMRAARGGLPESLRLADAAQLEAHREVLADQIADWRPHAQWQDEAARRHRARQEWQREVETLRARLATVRERRAVLPALISENESHLDAAAAVVARQSGYEADLAAAQEQIDALARLAQAQVALARAEQQVRTRQEAFELAHHAAQEANAALQILLKAQWEQRAADLAKDLHPGVACAVCGSTEHPALAALSAGAALVTEADIEGADQRRRSAETTRDEAQAERDRCEAVAVDARVKVAACAAAVGEATAESLQAAAAAAEAGIAECAAAQVRRSELADQVRALRDEGDHLQDREVELAGQIPTLEQRLEAHDKQEQAELQWQLDTFGGAVVIRTLVAQAENERAAIASALEAERASALATAAVPEQWRGRTAADLTEPLQASAAELAEAQQARKAAEDRAATWSAASQSVARLHGELGAAVEASAEVLRRTVALVNLADIATAKGANRHKTPLEDYAMQRRFEEVLAAASVHAERMSGGRFSLALETSAGRGNAGLGIAILDGLSGKQRPPSTLSGGETFYVSLALALGLADVVMGEGGIVPLETLFVDEGFGSLDQDTLEIVMGELARLQDSGRVVGLISHVEEMKRWIPERIVVERLAGADGSVVRQ